MKIIARFLLACSCQNGDGILALDALGWPFPRRCTERSLRLICLRMRRGVITEVISRAKRWQGSSSSVNPSREATECVFFSLASYQDSCARRLPAWIHRSMCTCSSRGYWCSREHIRHCSRFHTRPYLKKTAHTHNWVSTDQTNVHSTNSMDELHAEV